MRTYSSGMYGRLAFSVAVNMDPDILLVDEALSVGDARFKKKSFERMQELCAQAGTILLVSHALRSVEQLCTDVAWMHNGELSCSTRPPRSSRPTPGSWTSATSRSPSRTSDGRPPRARAPRRRPAAPT